jgi:sulfate transport system permease protein
MSSAIRLPRRVLPGFGLTLGYTVLYLSVIVLIPMSTLLFKSFTLSWTQVRSTLSDPEVVAAFRLSFGASAVAAVLDAIFGLIIAWSLARYRFFGRRLMDAIIDVPFALPTAVAGIVLTNLFSENGLYGHVLLKYGIKIAYTPAGIVTALLFIGLPFVVRTVQPVIEDLERDVEEAAEGLGANRLQVLLRILLPSIFPSLLTGFALAFARGVGEYGSIVFISGNLPFKTEIVPFLIVSKLQQFQDPTAYAQATTIAVAMLAASLLILGLINFLQWWRTRSQ